MSPNLAFVAASLSISAGGVILNFAMNWKALELASRTTTSVDLNIFALCFEVRVRELNLLLMVLDFMVFFRCLIAWWFSLCTHCTFTLNF